MACTNCNGTFYLRSATDEDTWIPCECFREKRWTDSCLKGVGRIASDLPAGDLILISDPVEKLKPIVNKLIWDQLGVDLDSVFAYSYAGDMATAFLTHEAGLDYESPDILFIYLVVGEATPKLVGRVVNQVYEQRKNEGLRTVFLAPYGGVRLQKRYSEEDQALGQALSRLKEIPV